MRLTGISIQKYRSIKKTPRLNLGSMTVLVGPNNEGKSNILRGMATSMRILRRFGIAGRSRQTAKLYLATNDYNWADDYPKDLQLKTPDGNTIIDLWFELSDDEKSAFHELIGVKLKTELPIRLTLNRWAEFSVRKQGPGRVGLMKKSGQIASFIGQRLRIEYVQSVRTAKDAASVVRDMLSEQLDEIFEEEEYQAALETLTSALQPVLTPLSEELTQTLSDFLPEVKNVTIDLPVYNMAEILARQSRILVDDGVSTELSFKGDGVQSLAALALVRKSVSIGRRALFLALEEPEAHLHPRAIHQVRKVLADIAVNQQVVVTTHSPLLVNRFNLNSNIIVRGSRAQPADSISDLRACLGVRAADNLSSASLVLLVEGLCDERAIKSIIAEQDPDLCKKIDEGTLAIESLNSAANLSAKLESLRQQICRYIVLLDNDASGILAAEKARGDGLLLPSEEHFTIAPGMKESEFEDCLDPDVYTKEIVNSFGVNLNSKEFRKAGKKWSDRVSDTFRSQGKQFDPRVKAAVKRTVAEAVVTNGQKALHPQRSTALIALISEVRRQLDDISTQ